jgi:hypothetical protein
MLNLPKRTGGGARNKTLSAKLSVNECGKAMKAESWGGVTSQPPKAGQKVDSRVDLWDTRQHSKLNCPTLLEEELTKQSCS